MRQGEAARRIGVSEDCLCYWENGRNEPRLYQYPTIIAFLTYYPFDHETATFGGKIKRYKYEHGLSNEKLAKLLGVDEGTVANWERNKRVPAKKRMKYVLSVITNNTLRWGVLFSLFFVIKSAITHTDKISIMVLAKFQ